MDALQMKAKMIKLAQENEQLKQEVEKYKSSYTSLHKKYSELNNQHQQDCIDKNQLITTVDILVDRYSNLRNIYGMSIYKKYGSD